MSPNRTGRSKGGPKYIQVYAWEFDCAAYRSLSCAARCLLLEIKRRYNGQNNRYVSMSVREAAARLERHKNSMTPVFGELIDKGFIRSRKKGSFNLKARHATEWILTEYPVGSQLATKDSMAWRPADESGKVVEIAAVKRKTQSQ